MAIVGNTIYRIGGDCPVKWTTSQERSLVREYPFNLTEDERPEPYVLRAYLQALYLPESIMPLQHLMPSMLRVTSPAGPSLVRNEHPLRTILPSVLLTPRTSSQKYQTRIPHLLHDEDAPPEPEANMLWYTYKYEKTGLEDLESVGDGEQEAAEEKWRKTWLDRLERREVMIQILLHFLLLSLSEPPSGEDEAFGSPDLLMSPRKRKRATAARTHLSYEMLEERVEGFMDKLSMWQLTDSLGISESDTDRTKQVLPNVKGKGKLHGQRDDIQAFCEDVVEFQFKATLPSHCNLLRSKVFPRSPFSDDDTDTSPPMSPQHQHKRVKTSAPSSRRTSPHSQTKPQARQLERSRSLSATLEQERERSRSLSIGPSNMRKRVLTREISMSTVFKPKPAKPKVRAAIAEKKSAAAPQEQFGRNGQVSAGESGDTGKGRTLVAATPVKPKVKSANHIPKGTLSKQSAPKIPALDVRSVQTGTAMSVEGDADEDNWMLPGSPDILLLTSSSGKEDWESSDEEGENAGADGFSQVMAAETPTKPTRTR